MSFYLCLNDPENSFRDIPLTARNDAEAIEIAKGLIASKAESWLRNTEWGVGSEVRIRWRVVEGNRLLIEGFETVEVLGEEW